MHLLLATVLAQPPAVQEAWLRLPSPAERREAEAMGAHFVEGVDGEWVQMQARSQDWPALLQSFESRALPMSVLPVSLAGYHSPEQMNQALYALAESSQSASIRSLGQSLEGREILSLELGPLDAPSWRIVGAHHVDEALSAELALAVAQALLEGQGPWQGLLQDLHVSVVPMLNPDGVAAGSRYNSRGVDLNRNYGYQWGTGSFRGTAPFSEPETRALRTQALYQGYQAGLSLHTGALNLGWPWNWTLMTSPEEELLQELAQDYQAECTAPGFWITNGAAWYQTTGDCNDWSLARRGTLDFTLEAWEEKQPEQATMEQVLDLHLPAVAALLQRPVNLRVEVRDAQSGAPVQAELSVGSRAEPFWTDPSGVAWRMLEVGVFELQVRAAGFEGQSVELRVPAEQQTEVFVNLEPSYDLDLEPNPRVLACCDPQLLTIPGLPNSEQPLTLSRPGFEDQLLDPEGGGWLLDPLALAAGPWSLHLEQGVLPNALLVASQGGLVSLESVRLESDSVVLAGAGFGQGAQLFLLRGHRGSLEALSLLSSSPTQVVGDLSGMELSGTVDLVLVSQGQELAVTDLLDDPTLDPGRDADPYTPAAPPGASGPVFGYGGCSTGSRWGFTLVPWLLALAALTARREKRCAL